ncbi:Molybdopterin converting factor, small subunit [Georgenia satyanarayanai]|uniref:Molybdopterin converting factor, small subunit n=1 Tax=Georgenia satyanarayanai TaxID=860221 RepID=A0A2Y9AAG6_9MICO|nr:MoaD/ThiS family protein [Georgenia satyanarayanai]PYG01028.1 molybdopterin converting factor small subunit [Georgenia satyanarayanai]SSA39267.1 Molybdopterin converting factor, small subunit [Georgenia satyanarayanai]
MSTVRYFAAAAEAAGREQEPVEPASVGELRAALAERHGERLARVMERCSVLVNGVRSDNDAQVGAGDVVDVLPPFAGG